MGVKYVTICHNFQVNSLQRCVSAVFSPPSGHHLLPVPLRKMHPVRIQRTPCTIWRGVQEAPIGSRICHTIGRISGKHACRLSFLGAQATVFHRVNCSRCVTQACSVLHINLGAGWQEQQMAAKFVAVCQYFHPFTHISPLSGRRFQRWKLHWIHVTNAHHPAPAMWREVHGAANASWHYVMPAWTILTAYRASLLRSIRL